MCMIIMKDKKKAKILLIGASGGGVTEGLLKGLRHGGYTNMTLLAYSENSVHLHRVADTIIINTNPDDGEKYIDALISVCTKNNINIIVPGSTWESRAISVYEQKFYDHNIVPLVNNIETIKIGDDKWNTFLQLTELDIPTPKSFLTVEDILNDSKTEFPVIIKPRQGRGSQNVFKVNSREELDAICKYFDIKKIKYILQEYMDRDAAEYTVGVISDNKGNAIESIVMRRLLMGGATGFAEVMEHTYINDFCMDVANKIGSTGPINVQLRLDNNDQPSVFEINPRFSGSSPMRTLAGFNEIDKIIEIKYCNKEIEKSQIEFGNKYYRAFQEVEIKKDELKGQITNLL